jgi:hypothetical protein
MLPGYSVEIQFQPVLDLACLIDPDCVRAEIYLHILGVFLSLLWAGDVPPS